MSIPDHLIEEVRSRADLVELVAEHTSLRRSGRTFRGPCPLHGGKGPNFSVDPNKNIFKCFVCGEGGDIFSFPMKHLGMDFLDAVRYVAERVGVEIPEPGEIQREMDPLAHLHETNAFAAAWFQRGLWEDDGAAEAREYLTRRGIGREATERFGLGWAPESWSALLDAAHTHGIPDDTLIALGLAKERAKSKGELYDAFRGRLIFPIEEPGGRVVAFGGRILGDAEPHTPKYLNSPETPVYHKGDVLYGLGWSRGAIRKAETALVVEGYMDYVSLAAHGIPNAVAPLGTAMTPRQAELVARYARRIVLLYDSDAAGLKATFRSGDELLRTGVEVLVATLPGGEDPDSLVRGKGAGALAKIVDDAVDLLERKIQILERRDYFGSISGTRRAVDALLPTVRATSDDLLRGVYLGRIAEKTGIPRETLEREAVRESPRDVHSPRSPDRNQRRGQSRERGSGTPTQLRGMGPERNLVLLLLRDEAWVERAAQAVGPDDLHNPVYRRIYEGILHVEGERDADGAWLTTFPETIRPAVEELLGDPEAAHLDAPERFLDASIQHILARPFEERLAQIEREFGAASPEQQVILFREATEIRGTMRERGLPLKSGFLRIPELSG